MKTIRNEEDLQTLRVTTRLAAVIGAWAQRGLFEALAEAGPMRIGGLPGDERALRITARILAHAGLLVHRDEEWALTPVAAQLQDDQVLGGGGGLEYLQNLGQLDELLEDGGPVADEEGEKSGTEIGVDRDDAGETQQFQEMLYRRSERSAKAAARWVDRELDEQARVLDLGGGHGRYAMELSACGHDVTLFDLPVSVNVARQMHGDELNYISGDFFHDDLGGPYDLVFASNIVHGLSAGQNAQLVSRIAESLAPSGQVVIKDMFLDEFQNWPPSAVYFGLTMLLCTDDGDSYSLEETHDWFRSAGLIAEEPVVFERFSLAIGSLDDPQAVDA